MSETDNKRSWFKYYPWKAETGKVHLLTAAEFGIFVRLCNRIWIKNGAVKNDELLARFLGTTMAELSSAITCYRSLDIICEKDGFLSVKFISEQIAELSDESEKKAVAGHKGAQVRWQSMANKKRIDKIREEENREEKDINTATTAAGGKTDYPKDTDALIQEAAKRAYLMSVEEAARFINDGQSSGWTIDGRPVKNWRKLLDYCKLKQTPAQRHMAVEESRRRKQGLPATPQQEEKLVRLKDGRLIPESQSVHNVGTLPDGTPFDEYVEGSFP